MIALLLPALLTAASTLTLPESAGWPHDPGQALPIAVGAGATRNVRAASDGTAGLIVGWQRSEWVDGRVLYDLRAQRIDANGKALWSRDGVILGECGTLLAVAPDGHGGAYVVWQASRLCPSDDRALRAQRVSADGELLWGSEGVWLTESGPDPVICDPQAVLGSKDGLIVAWHQLDSFSSRTPGSIWAQWLDPHGRRMWNDGLLVAKTEAGLAASPRLARSTLGGIIVSYIMEFPGRPHGMWAQRVLDSGALAWNQNGVPIALGVPEPSTGLISTPDGGAILAWQGDDVRIQRLSASGELLWGDRGLVLSPGYQPGPPISLVMSSSDAVVAVWTDSRSGLGEASLQRVRLNGEFEWGPHGRRLAPEQAGVGSPRLVKGTEGTVTILYVAPLTSIPHLHAQRMDADGNALWEPGGLLVSHRRAGHDWVSVEAPWGDAYVAFVQQGAEYGLFGQRVPFSITAKIDFRPRNKHNVANLNSSAKVPIAVLGTPDLPVATIEPWSITVNGAPIQSFHLPRDLDRDGLADLTVNVNAKDLQTEPPEATVRLSGHTHEGRIFSGADRMRLLGAHDTTIDHRRDQHRDSGVVVHASSSAIVVSAENGHGGSLELFDLMGRRLAHRLTSAGTSWATRFEVGGGVFFLRFRSEGYSFTRKVVVQR